MGYPQFATYMNTYWICINGRFKIYFDVGSMLADTQCLMTIAIIIKSAIHRPQLCTGGGQEGLHTLSASRAHMATGQEGLHTLSAS